VASEQYSVASTRYSVPSSKVCQLSIVTFTTESKFYKSVILSEVRREPNEVEGPLQGMDSTDDNFFFPTRMISSASRMQKTNRVSIWVAALAALSLTASLYAQIRFQTVTQEVIDTRLHGFAGTDFEREARLKTMFAQSGCKSENLSEEIVKTKQPPNLVCVLRGNTDQVIVVGAHFDHVTAGDGVVDNWTGASLLPSLFDSVSREPRRHTYVFISFMGEEQRMLGSEYYVSHLSEVERSHIRAMINMDTLGLGTTEVWVSHSDERLVRVLDAVSQALKIPLRGMNVEKVGTTDSESFAHYKIPRITLHSLTQQTLPILHSSKDRLDKIRMGDYYESYRLIAAYLIALDTLFDAKPTPPAPDAGTTEPNPGP
jgi:hypothetical protein